jgi:hypothetical protein
MAIRTKAGLPRYDCLETMDEDEFVEATTIDGGEVR